jgi:hypothetical protein
LRRAPGQRAGFLAGWGAVLAAIGLVLGPAPGLAAPASGQTFLHYPTGVGAFDWGLGVGATLDVLSPVLVESEQRFVPRLTGTFRYGLPLGFSIEASLDAIVLTNELRVGALWSVATGPVSWAVHDRVGLWFGWIGVSGFDTRAVGLVQYPGATVGTRLGEHRLSLSFEWILVHAQQVDFGDATVSRVATANAGFSARLMVESPAGPGVIFYGVTLYRASPDYQLWLAFSDGRRKLQFVRLAAGYEF